MVRFSRRPAHALLWAGIASCVFLAVLASSDAKAQSGLGDLIGGTSGSSSGMGLQGRSSALSGLAARALPTQNLVLEGAIDADTYIVGPGDVFSVSIGGSLPRTMQATVSADGTLVIPEAGSFSVWGRTLAQTSRVAGAALARRYANVVTDVTLASPRQFFVHVGGAVPVPGRHTVFAVSRVEDALASASGTPTALSLAQYGRPSPVRSATVSEARPALRNVLVSHLDGTQDRIDVMRYFATGDVEFNRLLRDGDAISVQTFDPIREGVIVGGAVDRPGVYDVRPDDDVLDLLMVASGRDVSLRLVGVRLGRTDESGAASVQELSIADASRTRVQKRDQIYGIAANADAGAVEVAGAVRYPGIYRIRAGTTTLDELIEMAGGLKADALTRGAFLERRERAIPEDQWARSAVEEASLRNPTETSPLAVDDGVLTDLDLFSRSFLASELNRTPRVAIDLTQSNGVQAVRIRDGDRLVVPIDLGGVRVNGQVRQPGYVPYVPGQSADAYVATAGGRGPGATDTYILEAGSGRLSPAADQALLPGDAVFVDREPTAESPVLAQLALQERAAERQERQDERLDRQDRRQARYQLIQTVFGVLGTVATMILALNAVR